MATGKKKTSSRTYLSTEIILEILSRLPAKPLFRFKCASRSWFSLIDGDNYFIRPKTLPSMLLGFYYSSDKFYYLDDDDNNHNNTGSRLDTSLNFLPSSMSVVDSCNGLLMCWKLVWPFEFYCVCNPATKRWAALPTFPLPRYLSSRHLALLAYDPYVSSCHYKVVVWVASSYSATDTDIYIFSSEKRELGWVKDTIFQANLFFSMDMDPGHCVFREDTFYIPFGNRIIKHSLQQGTVHVFSFPSGAKTVESSLDLREYHIGILGGAICFGTIIDSHLRIWTLVENDKEDDDGNSTSWVLKHNIVLQIERPFFFEFFERPLLILAFHPSVEVIFIEMAHGVWSYNLNINTMVAVFGGRGYRTIQEHAGIVGFALPYTPCYTDVLKGNTPEFLYARLREASSSKMPLQSQRQSGASYPPQLGYYSQQQIHFKSETSYSQLHGPYPQQQGLYPQQSRSQQHTPLQPQIQYVQQRHHHQQQENHIQHGIYEQPQQHGQYLHQGLYLRGQQHGQYLHQGFYLPQQQHDQYLQPYQPQHGHQPQQGHHP